MVQLIDDLKNTRLAFTCPHGRPTMVLLTPEQLARQFKRIT
jgi:DNA mismatch repair ATPase MutL